jgi:hypothetical protein
MIMKKLLFLPMLLISCLCFAQDSKEIIGKPVKIGKIEVAQKDFSTRFNWHDAKVACLNLGKGWRLPTKEELNLLYQNKEKIGSFAPYAYWSAPPVAVVANIVECSIVVTVAARKTCI